MGARPPDFVLWRKIVSLFLTEGLRKNRKLKIREIIGFTNSRKIAILSSVRDKICYTVIVKDNRSITCGEKENR